MADCCDTCIHKLRIIQYDYSNGGCTHRRVKGYACMCLKSEGVVIWMYGNNPDVGVCEEYHAIHD